jgi:hypothetical protein
MNMLEIQYYQELTTSGFIFTSTVARSGNVTWSRVSEKVKTLARDAHGRVLMSKTTDAVRAYFLTLQDMTHITDFPDSEGTRATTILRAISWYI